MSFLSEIHEQPEVLDRTLQTNLPRVRAATERLGSHPAYVVVAARGTSDNGARYAQYLWGARNGLSVALAAPSLVSVYGRPPSLRGALVVGISQSGQSPDIVSVLREGRSQGCVTLAITNDAGSPLAQAADIVLELLAGAERSVAATKTYTTELLAVALLSAALADDHEMVTVLARVPGWAAWMLDTSPAIASRAQAFADIDRCAVLGRGFNHATAFEWALKLQETCTVLAQGASTADFQHGPAAAIRQAVPVFAVAPGGASWSTVRDALVELRRERGMDLLWISDRDDDALGPMRIPLPPDIPEWATPMVAIVGAQLFCHHLALASGLDPDAPPGLRKVTRTR